MYYLNIFYYNIFCKCYEPLKPLAHLHVFFFNRPFRTENGFCVVLLQQTDLTILKQVFFSKVFSTFARRYHSHQTVDIKKRTQTSVAASSSLRS